MTDPAHIALMAAVAKHFFGQPNAQLSKKTELRFGTRGSKSVDLEKGAWYDHETGEGGGPLDLIMRETGLTTAREAYQWAEREGYWGNGNPSPKARKAVAYYDYTDEAGVLLFQKVRYEPKDFSQRRPDGNRGWIWKLGDVRRVLYRLPEAIETIGNGHLILVVEGEKDVDNCWRLGVPATCNEGGANKWSDALTPIFEGADVVIIGDNDEPGRSHVKDVASRLSAVASRVRVLDLAKVWPQCPPKGDISEWIEETNGTAEQLHALIAQAEPTMPPKPSFRQTSAQFVADFVPPDYLLDGVLIRRYLYSFTGRTGSGKTAVTLLLAACIARGRLFGGREVSRGCVFYLCGENPDDVRMRWIALAKELGFDPETIDVHFFPKRFLISEKYAELAAEAQAVGGVALVIVDTSQAYFEGDNFNDNVQQLKHAQRLRTLTELHGGPTVVVNSHPVKNAALDNLIPCGGGNFLNEVDGNLTCVLNGVVINVGWQGKFRGPDFSLTFRVRTVTNERLKDSRGRLMPTVIAEQLSESAEQEIAAAARNHEDQLLAEIAKDGHASFAEYARRCGWTYQSGEPNRSLVQRTIGRLKDLRLITQDDRDGFALTKKGQEALKSIPANGKTNGNIHASLKVAGDCPQDATCAYCQEGGNGKKGIVQNIALNRPDATPLPLHRKCAEQWFHVRDDTRGRGRYPRN